MRVFAASGVGAAILLGAALLMLWQRSGVAFFSEPQLGATLASPIWALTLAACALGAGLLDVGAVGPERLVLLRPFWLYPLARLYELGPWNWGWSLAALLLGGGAALWLGALAPWPSDPAQRAGRVSSALLAGSLATLGLATGAGLAGGMFGMLAAVLVGGALALGRRSKLLWIAAGPLPLTLPFAALWMQIGAAVTGGAPGLAVALWLAAIGWAIAALRLLSSGPDEGGGVALRLLAALSLVCGVAGQVLVQRLVLPATFQMAAAITPYGRPSIWPWLGLDIASDDGKTTMLWRSSAVAALMLLLAALAWIVLRLLALRATSEPASDAPAVPSERLWDVVRRSVPWLPQPREGRDDA